MKLFFMTPMLVSAALLCGCPESAKDASDVQGTQVTLEDCESVAADAGDGGNVKAYDKCLTEAGIADPYTGGVF